MESYKLSACWSPSGRLFTLSLPDSTTWLIDVESAQIVRRIAFRECEESIASNFAECKENAENEEVRDKRKWRCMLREVRNTKTEEHNEYEETHCLNKNKLEEEEEILLNIKTTWLSNKSSVNDSDCMKRNVVNTDKISTFSAINNNQSIYNTSEKAIIATTWTTLPLSTNRENNKTTSLTTLNDVYHNLAMHIPPVTFTNALLAEMHLSTSQSNDNTNKFVNKCTNVYNKTKEENTEIPFLFILTNTGMLHLILGGLREVFCVRCYDSRIVSLSFCSKHHNEENCKQNTLGEDDAATSSTVATTTTTTTHLKQFCVSHERKRSINNNTNKQNWCPRCNKKEMVQAIHDSSFTPNDILTLLHQSKCSIDKCICMVNNTSNCNSNDENNNSNNNNVDSVDYSIDTNKSSMESNVVLYLVVESVNNKSNCNTLYEVDIDKALQMYSGNYNNNSNIILSTSCTDALLTWVCVAEHLQFALDIFYKILGKWTQFITPTLFLSQLQLSKSAPILAELLVERCVVLDEIRLLCYLCTLNLPQLWQRKKEIVIQTEEMKMLITQLVLPHLQVALQLTFSANCYLRKNTCNSHLAKKAHNFCQSRLYFTELAEAIGNVIHLCESFVPKCLIVESNHINHLLHWLVQRSSLLLNACDEVTLQKIVMENYYNNTNNNDSGYTNKNEDSDHVVITHEIKSSALEHSKEYTDDMEEEESVSFNLDDLCEGNDNKRNKRDTVSNKKNNEILSNEEDMYYNWSKPGVVYNVEPLPAEWHPSLFSFLNTFEPAYTRNQEWASESLAILVSCIELVEDGAKRIAFVNHDKRDETNIYNTTHNLEEMVKASRCTKVLQGMCIDLDVFTHHSHNECNSDHDSNNNNNKNESNNSGFTNNTNDKNMQKLLACYLITPELIDCKSGNDDNDTFVDKRAEEVSKKETKYWQCTYVATTVQNSCNTEKNNYSYDKRIQRISCALLEKLSTSLQQENNRDHDDNNKNNNNNDNNVTIVSNNINNNGKNVTKSSNSSVVYYCHLNDERHLLVVFTSTTVNEKDKISSTVEVITMKEQRTADRSNNSNNNNNSGDNKTCHQRGNVNNKDSFDSRHTIAEERNLKKVLNENQGKEPQEWEEEEQKQMHANFTIKKTASIQGLHALSASQIHVSASKEREFVVIAAYDTIIVIDLYAEDEDNDDDDDDDNNDDDNSEEQNKLVSEGKDIQKK